jgi:hypothetical protein
MRLALLLLAASLQADPPPDTIITLDGARIEATGVSVEVMTEGATWVIRVTPK